MHGMHIILLHFISLIDWIIGFNIFVLENDALETCTTSNDHADISFKNTNDVRLYSQWAKACKIKGSRGTMGMSEWYQ